MKIIAYGYRDDEMPYLSTYQKMEGVELELKREHLTPETASWANGADGVSITGVCRADREVLKQLADGGVRFLSTRTVGYNQIDLEAAKTLGIRCANVTYSPYGVANYTVLLILAILRKFMHIMVRSGCMDYSLKDMQGKELQNMTVGIIGMGRIGKAVARCLSGFGCRIIAFTPHPDEETRTLAEIMTMDELYAQADIITLHTPATPETYHLICKATLDKMKKGVYIINTARGELINTGDLIDAVESGQVGGVAIDSFEHEQDIIHVDHEYNVIRNRQMLILKAYPNVLVSPHAAFYTDQASSDMVRCSIEGLLSWGQGKENPFELNV